MSIGSLLVRAIGVIFIAWPLVQNLMNYMPRWSQARLQGVFPFAIGVQLLLMGKMIDRPGAKPRDWWILLFFTTALVVCWLTGQLLAAVIVFLLQFPFLFRLDREDRSTPRP